MAILEHEVRSAAESNATGLSRHLYTRGEYYRVGETGVFDASRVELIEGEVIAMAPIGPFHAASSHPIAVTLEKAFGPAYSARNQAPIALGDDAIPSEPQPDVVVAAGSWRDYMDRHPAAADIALVVEIAESSLTYDRTVKAALYSSAGIPEYWILNLADRQLEVYREPSATGYATATILHSGESVEPLLAPGKPIALAEFMP